MKATYTARLPCRAPDAERCMRDVLGMDSSGLDFYTFETWKVYDGDPDIIVSRTGYTGEDGFEIYASDERISEFLGHAGQGWRATLWAWMPRHSPF